MSSKSLDPSLISAEDVYTRMIDLKFPAELAERFKNEMKDGLLKYIQAEEIPIVKSKNVALTMALLKLVASFIGRNFEERVNRVNSTVGQLIMSEPWPINSKLAKTTDESKPEQSQAKVLSQPKVMPDKEPFKNISNTIASTSSSVMVNRDASQSGKLSQSLIKKPELSPSQLDLMKTTPACYEYSNIRIFIYEQLVNFPKFSNIVEADLNCEDKCLQALSHACLELAVFFVGSNIDLRKSNEYKMIANAILTNYEVLDGIINRCILNGWFNNLPAPPKTSQAHVCKALQAAMSKVRNIHKKEMQKERVQAVYASNQNLN